MREVTDRVHVIVGMRRRLVVDFELALAHQVDDAQLRLE